MFAASTVGPSSISSVAPNSAHLADWLAWIETLSPREIVLGLDRVKDVLERLELPRPERVISVAGTNGKGSTVAILEALYSAMGLKVACYTSPHVIRFNERMRVAGQPLSDDAILSAFRIVEKARGDIPLTYFEFGTLAAFVAFAAMEAQVQILEVGLGGRLDAVNAIDPDGSVICNVSLDHCAWLGTDIETIAGEKAGVMRTGTPVVFGASPAPDSIVKTAADKGATLLLADQDFHADSHGDADADQWTFTYRETAPVVLQKPSLTGTFQIANAAAALALFFTLEGRKRLKPGVISAALRSLQIPGRMQRLHSRSRHWLLDVAHNPASAAVLAGELARMPGKGKRLAVIGVMADKDVEAMLQPLLPLVDRWIAVTASGSRALPALTLASKLAAQGHCPCRIAADVDDALAIATRLATQDDLIVIAGSFYIVGPALEKLGPVDDSTLGYTRGAD